MKTHLPRGGTLIPAYGSEERYRKQGPTGSHIGDVGGVVRNELSVSAVRLSVETELVFAVAHDVSKFVSQDGYWQRLVRFGWVVNRNPL